MAAKDWLVNYLSNRKIRCKIQHGLKDYKSGDYNMLIGTQGSCLGPLLFQLFVNDLQLNLTKSECILFADDTTLYKTGPKLHDVVKDIKSDINTLLDWFKTNTLSLNINKTNCMVFGSKGKPILTFDNITILIVTGVKFLGITVDDNMSWKEHTATLINNLISHKYILQLVRKFIPTQAKRLLYCVHVLSRINYGHVIWEPMINQASENKFFQIQKIAYVL